MDSFFRVVPSTPRVKDGDPEVSNATGIEADGKTQT